MSSLVHLHLDDAPATLAILAALLGHRQDRAELGYTADEYGADVDWDRLANGKLSSTEIATVHIARGVAIAERRGGLPESVRAAVRAARRRDRIMTATPNPRVACAAYGRLLTASTAEPYESPGGPRYFYVRRHKTPDRRACPGDTSVVDIPRRRARRG